MLKNVRCNVEDYRVLHDGVQVEDVTKADLPQISRSTTQVKATGMLMDVDMPNWFHFEAMELGISHNNGNNCSRFAMPRAHNIEMRVARQNYSVTKGDMDLELVKVRARVVHKSTEKGSVETNNPLGSNEKFSVLRYGELASTTEPEAALTARYEAQYRKFSKIYPALKGVFPEIK